jgi:hypothetical protein
MHWVTRLLVGASAVLVGVTVAAGPAAADPTAPATPSNHGLLPLPKVPVSLAVDPVRIGPVEVGPVKVAAQLDLSVSGAASTPPQPRPSTTSSGATPSAPRASHHGGPEHPKAPTGPIATHRAGSAPNFAAPVGRAQHVKPRHAKPAKKHRQHQGTALLQLVRTPVGIGLLLIVCIACAVGVAAVVRLARGRRQL